MALSEEELDQIKEKLQDDDINEKDFLEQYSKLIAESVETNTKIFNEIKSSTEEIKSISSEISNGMSSVINKNAEKINDLHTDICSKEGYLPQISNKISYLGVPAIPAIVAIILGVIEYFSSIPK